MLEKIVGYRNMKEKVRKYLFLELGALYVSKDMYRTHNGINIHTIELYVYYI